MHKVRSSAASAKSTITKPKSLFEFSRSTLRVNPEDEWVRGEVPALRIIKQRLWDRVRKRQRQEVCPKAAASLEVVRRIFRGRPRSLLTGLLKCGSCGGNFTIRRGNRFSCSTSEHLKECDNHLRIGRVDLEIQVLASLTE